MANNLHPVMAAALAPFLAGMPKAKRYSPAHMVESTVAGIPCLIDVLSISGSYVPAKTNADPDSCYPAEYPEVDFEVCDRNGRPAPWLTCKMTDNDTARIEEQILEGV